ncbi:mucoidy inhibitor MuiA family protein [Formosa sp. S-31]|uniref:DUF4139 domain-containing protein n=1 Tax=Formosa sp. S-31 TaxID=2790949 RepID=UPI003EBF6EA0
MKIVYALLFSLLTSTLSAQDISEKKIDTKVNEVTVFLDGAQIVRQKSVNLSRGTTVLKFINLSPFIDAKSVQVKAQGALTVLAVNHQQNFLDKLEKSEELTALETQLEDLKDKLQLESTYLAIIKDELSFLEENKDVGGRNDQVSVNNLQQASNFYSTKLTSLKLKEIERNKTIKALHNQRRDIQNQINTLTSKKTYPTGEILVKAEVKQTGTYPLELTYVVGNAGWYPSYDIRAKNINEPVQLMYKANVKQDTKVDWTDVKLKFSSATPNVSGVAPELETYFINYNTLPPSYNRNINSVNGKVTDANGEPLPGVNVLVEGTTIGATTDFDGHYAITIPNNAGQLSFSYLGFLSKTQPITSAVINVSLEEDTVSLDEVVVVGYGSKKKDNLKMLRSRATGIAITEQLSDKTEQNSQPIPVAQIENQTTVDFEIKTPYTINSDNKNYSVDMENYELPAFYQYYSVPKIDKDAFLIANIVNWEQYHLLEGEANVFFEDTYVGKTLMDVRYASDTLEISLGRDKKITVNREKIKDYTSKQFIGNKKEETRAWKTTVKNNKNQTINMIILDQVPVATLEEITVNIEKLTGGKQDQDTGIITWEFELEPNTDKMLELKYSVKYPKSKNLLVE